MSPENPSKHPIRDLMNEEVVAKGRALYPEQARIARVDEDGDVEVPEIPGPRFYVDPKDGQLHQREAGKRLPPHARAA